MSPWIQERVRYKNGAGSLRMYASDLPGNKSTEGIYIIGFVGNSRGPTVTPPDDKWIKQRRRRKSSHAKELGSADRQARVSMNRSVAMNASDAEPKGRATDVPSWQTSNMQYGRFYGQRASSAPSQGEGIRVREGRCEVLTKTVINCQKQLGHMRLRDATPSHSASSLHAASYVGDEDYSSDRQPLYSSYCDAHLQRLRSMQQQSNDTITRPTSCTLRGSTSNKCSTYEDACATQYSSREGYGGNHINHYSKYDPNIVTSRKGHYNARDVIDASGIREDAKQLESLLHKLTDKLQTILDHENVQEGSIKTNEASSNTMKKKPRAKAPSLVHDPIKSYDRLVPYYKSGPYYESLYGNSKKGYRNKRSL